MDWYYADEGKQIGPLGSSALERLVIDGTVKPGTLVWHEGMDEWRPYGEIQRDLTIARDAPIAEDSEHFCIECGNPFSRDYMIKFENSWVCADCKQIYVQKLKEGGNLSGTVEYGGFWIRVGAKIIDAVIMGVVSSLFSVVIAFIFISGDPDSMSAVMVQVAIIFLNMLIGTAYTTFFLGKYGATLGKMALKLKVVRSDGEPLSYGRAFGRHFADLLSGLILYIGYIIAAFDEEKRALHDHICDTRVVRN